MLNGLLNPVMVVVTLFVCTVAYGYAFTGHDLVLAVVAFFVSAHVLDDVDLFTPWRPFQMTRVARNILAGWAIVVSVIVFLGYAARLIDEYAQEVVLTWFVATPLVLFASIKLARIGLRSAVSQGVSVRSAVVVGANDLGRGLARQMIQDPYLGMGFKGFFDDRDPQRLGAVDEGPILGGLSDLAEYVRREGVSLVYVSLPMVAQPRIVRLMGELRDSTASVYFVPDIFVFDLIQGRMDTVAGMPVVAVCETPFTGFNAAVKRLSDIVLSSLILVLIAPLLLAVAAGVKLSSPGPAIFKQRRYGLDGKEIIVWKFRSMSVTEDGHTSYTQVTRNDSRVTSFGAFIRKTSLDELPQFINVLQGRMSIVGPRPHAIAVNEQYRRLIPGYMIRHKVKPGITGWAQVNGYRGGDDLEHMQKRIECDLEYLRNWSLGLDLWIIVKTVLVMFKDHHAF